jgi:F0F1-type ATP synthase membrane subunit b/b'
MMQAMTRYQALFLSVVVAALPGCSTSFWYKAVQGAAYERCESIQDADERARCKSANFPDEAKYKKERSQAETR